MPISAHECEFCGTEFTAKRRDARFCSSKCRAKARRSGITAKEAVEAAQRVATDSKTPGLEDEIVASGAILRRCRAELESAHRESTMHGALAVFLAIRLERSAADNASGVAALVREFKATFAEAVANTKGKREHLDELEDRRAAKRDAARARAAKPS